MSKILFQCTLSTPNNKPLYKTYSGIGRTYIELYDDILVNVQAMKKLGIHILRYELPDPIELFNCWKDDKDIVYTIQCVDSQFDVEFKLTPKD